MASNLLNLPWASLSQPLGDLNENRSRHTALCRTRPGCRGLQPRIVCTIDIAEYPAGRNAIALGFVFVVDDNAGAGYRFVELFQHGAGHAAVVQLERNYAEHAAIDDPGYQLVDVEHAERQFQGQTVTRPRGLQTAAHGR
jgi:hypothetical protein